MARRPADARLFVIPLDRKAAQPLFRQVYVGIRSAILDGTLSPGARLPSTRGLASELGISRNTVLLAFEQLEAEGFVSAKVGGGSHVSPDLPRQFLGRADKSDASRGRRRLARRSANLDEVKGWGSSAPETAACFQWGLPAIDRVPFRLWSQVRARRLQRREPGLLSYGDPQGYLPLREAIANYLRTARGVHCDPEQVLVVNGSQQAIDLSARVILDPGDTAWVEDPGYPGARGPLQAAHADVVPMPVDDEGIQLDLEEQAPLGKPRLIYVTPSNQFPMGVTMSLSRRLELLNLANETGALILEDDYDSEFRYEGSPILSLQGLDQTGHVIYVGTFSKTIAPSIRLGYLVLPYDLLEPYVKMRRITDLHSPTVDQAVLADFIDEGHFVTHIGRMRRLYKRRRNCLVHAIETRLGDALEVQLGRGGMHLVGLLPEGLDDRRVWEAALRCGVKATPLSNFCLRPPARGGLVLGFAAFDERKIEEGVANLAQAIESVASEAGR